MHPHLRRTACRCLRAVSKLTRSSAPMAASESPQVRAARTSSSRGVRPQELAKAAPCVASRSGGKRAGRSTRLWRGFRVLRPCDSAPVFPCSPRCANLSASNCNRLTRVEAPPSRQTRLGQGAASLRRGGAIQRPKAQHQPWPALTVGRPAGSCAVSASPCGRMSSVRRKALKQGWRRRHL